MTIDLEVKQGKVATGREERSLPDAHRFAQAVLKRRSHYFNIALSSPHWQLKDLLISSSYSSYLDDYSCNQDPTFYFPYKNRIFSFNYSSLRASSDADAQSNVHTRIIKYSSIKFQSNPRCLKQLDGIVVTGGINNSFDPDTNPIGLHKGSFSVFNAQTSATENIQIGEFITNSVSINKLASSGSSHYRSYICNNDKFLYQFDITPSRVVQSANPVYLKVALNHSTLSNDNSTLITVGDSPKIFISHPQEGTPKEDSGTGSSGKNFSIIQTAGDCGFSTSFLSNGFQFVSCFQDGLALIYDLRNLSNPLHTIHSTRPKTQPGAFRVVKTSNYSDDLICLSEHQGRVHLIDSRNFNNHSVLLLPKYLYNVPPSISVSYMNDYTSDNLRFNTREDGDDDDGKGDTDGDDGDLSTHMEIDNDESGNNNRIGGHGRDRNQDHYSKLFGKYPIAISTDNKKDLSKQWYNQPIIKDIDDFKDLSHFGGDLNLGYLESYRYMDSRFRNYGDSFSTRYSQFRGESRPYKIVLQGTFDREDLLKRKLTTDYGPQSSNLLTYKEASVCPVQFRKRVGKLNKRKFYGIDSDDMDSVDDDDDNGDEHENYESSSDAYDDDDDHDDDDIAYRNTEIRYINKQCWWNSENGEKAKNFGEMWPWGKQIDGHSSDDDFYTYENSDGRNEEGGLTIMETPTRDPFFYVDSDIEINGLEIANRNGKSMLCIGTKEGIVLWDINNWQRKCFPSFGYA